MSWQFLLSFTLFMKFIVELSFTYYIKTFTLFYILVALGMGRVDWEHEFSFLVTWGREDLYFC